MNSGSSLMDIYTIYTLKQAFICYIIHIYLKHLNCNSFITKVEAVIKGYELILNYETFHCLSSLIYKADFLIYPIQLYPHYSFCTVLMKMNSP